MGDLRKSPNHDTYIVNGAMSADFTGDWIAIEDEDELTFFVEFGNTGTPVGALYVEWRKPGFTTPIRVALDKVHFSAGAAASHTAGNTNIAITGGAASALAIVLGMVVGEFRLFYDSTSGGAANTSLKAGFLKKRFK